MFTHRTSSRLFVIGRNGHQSEISVSREQVMNAGHYAIRMKERRQHSVELAPYLVYGLSRIFLHLISTAHSNKYVTNAIGKFNR